MKYSRILICSIGIMLTTIVGPVVAEHLTDIEVLGRFIFFDTDLSLNKNQSCAACHAPDVGWTGPDNEINATGAVYEGSVETLFGNRKPPSSAYATVSPIFHFVRRRGGEFVGGNFWDGRATGEKLGNPAADQAQGPFLNPVEQALPDSACVVERVINSPAYGDIYEVVFGGEPQTIIFPDNIDEVCADPNGMVELSDEDRIKVETAYDKIALAIAGVRGFRGSQRIYLQVRFLFGRKSTPDATRTQRARVIQWKSSVLSVPYGQSRWRSRKSSAFYGLYL